MEQTPILREGHEAPWKNDTNSGSLSMYWVFTAWQEPTLDHADPPGWLNYLTFGKEVCPTTDKTHWQGYIEFKTKKRIPWIRKQFKELMGVNDIYLALRRGTPQQAIAYAHKDGIITEIGVRPEKGGQRKPHRPTTHSRCGQDWRTSIPKRWDRQRELSPPSSNSRLPRRSYRYTPLNGTGFRK